MLVLYGTHHWCSRQQPPSLVSTPRCFFVLSNNNDNTRQKPFLWRQKKKVVFWFLIFFILPAVMGPFVSFLGHSKLLHPAWVDHLAWIVPFLTETSFDPIDWTLLLRHPVLELSSAIQLIHRMLIRWFIE